MADHSPADQRASEYAVRRKIELISHLGSGVNGKVWFTSRRTAVKVFDHQVEYEREWNVYARLTELDIKRINEFEVPQFYAWDEELLIIEMSVVQPPFVLDFAGAYLDRPPDFSPESLAEQLERNISLFGKRWSRVSLLLATLRSFDIYYIDINRGNIRFPEFDDEEMSDD